MQAEFWQINRIPVAHSLSLHAGSDPVACQCIRDANITDARPAVERRLDDADRTGAAEMPSGLSDSESPNQFFGEAVLMMELPRRYSTPSEGGRFAPIKSSNYGGRPLTGPRPDSEDLSELRLVECSGWVNE